jgi:hypothetical protein
LAHKTPYYDAKMLPKFFFDKNSICKIELITLNKTLMKHIQNNQKFIPAHGFLKNMKKKNS